MRRFVGMALLLAIVQVVAGCLPIITVKTRTRILPNGVATRETRIEKTRRQADNDQEKLWNERPISEDLGEGLGQGFVVGERTDDAIVLNGYFADPGKIPADFVRDVELLHASSSNRVQFQTEPILFGTRYLYRERFVDAIQPEDQEEARKELIQFVVQFINAAIRHEFGSRYESGVFELWTEKKLTPVLHDLIEIYWSERRALGKVDPHTGQTGFDRAVMHAVKRVGRLGLVLDPELDKPGNVVVLQSWFSKLMARTLKPRNRSAQPPQATDFAYLFPEESPLAGLEIMMERAAEREHGSMEEAEQQFQRNLLGVTGTYGSPPAEAEFRFDCAVEMPGVLLKTNGNLESGQAAFWLFEGQDIFPHGFSMEAESVVIDGSRLARIRELKSTLDLRDVVLLIRRLKDVSAEDRAEMSGILDQCAHRGTLTALEELQTEENKRMIGQLRQVLEVVTEEQR